jgi:hypothetical protein
MALRDLWTTNFVIHSVPIHQRNDTPWFTDSASHIDVVGYGEARTT